MEYKNHKLHWRPKGQKDEAYRYKLSLNNKIKPFNTVYTYQYDWLRPYEFEIASCPLGDGHWLSLTQYKLISHTGKNKHSYDLKEMIDISQSFRYLLLPMVVGGVAGPMSLVALMKGVVNPMIGFVMFLIGGLLIYYGMQGAHEIKINFGYIQKNLYVTQKTESLKNKEEIKAFVKLAKRQIRLAKEEANRLEVFRRQNK